MHVFNLEINIFLMLNILLLITVVLLFILFQPKLTLHIAMGREVVFTACGFFSLDYPLVHSVSQ